MIQVERAEAQRRSAALEQGSRRRRCANPRDVALRGHERIEGVEQNADRGGEAKSFGTAAGMVEQQRAGRLQLFGQRRLLTDRSSIGGLQIGLGIEDCRDSAQINGKFADRFARHQPARARVGDRGGKKREDDVGESAGGENRLDPHRRS